MGGPSSLVHRATNGLACPRPNAGIEPLEIHLASSGDLVLRGLTGEELEPAVLVGELIVNLVEPTNLKEIQ